MNIVYNEPCLTTLGRFADNSLDCVITSPPYWQLRDYGYEGQWGLEPTYQEYLEHLWQMMDQIYRCLKPQGTVWVNLGDTYSSFGGAQVTQTAQKNSGFEWTGSGVQQSRKDINYGVKNKCLLLLPHRFAIGCIERGWIMRNDCVWAKRNGMPESVTDRFSKKHEYFFFMVKSEKYYFDLDAIRDKHKEQSVERWARGVSETNKWVNGAQGQSPHNLSQPRPNIKGEIAKNTKFNTDEPDTSVGNLRNGSNPLNDKGKNPGDVADFWDVPTKGSSTQHYASYNDFLLKKPVLAGCPVGGLIYDPFMGTGSTAEVALRSDRKFIGSEMSKDYCAIATKRLKPFLQQQTLF